MRPRICVVVSAYGEGRLIAEAVCSVQEPSQSSWSSSTTDPMTRKPFEVLGRLERKGTPDRASRGERRCRRGPDGGLFATSAPLVYPLDADDLAVPGVIGRMADLLERHPDAAACVGDIYEFGGHQLIRTTPPRLDPYPLALLNEYPITALYRRNWILGVGGWRKLGPPPWLQRLGPLGDHRRARGDDRPPRRRGLLPPPPW